jgi:hypothetical protein
MQYKRPLILDILTWIHAFFLFAGLYPLLASILQYQGAAFWRMTTAGLVLFFPIVLSWLLMQRIHHFLLYLLTGILISGMTGVIAFLWCGSSSGAGLLCIIFSTFLALIIFMIRTRAKLTYGNQKEEFLSIHGMNSEFPLQEREIPTILSHPLPQHWVWYTLLYVCGMICGFTTFLYVMFGILFVDVFLMLAYHYISALYEYIRKNQKVANLPVATMRRIHRMIGYFAIPLLFLFLLPSLLYGKEFQPDLTRDTPLLKIDPIITEKQAEESVAPNVVNPLMTEAGGEPAETPVWIPALIRLISFLFVAGFTIMMIILFIRRIRHLSRDFAVGDEDEVVFLKPEQPDAIKRVRRRRHDEQQSLNQQIRRRYKKMIRKATKGQPNKWATPTELEKQAALSATEEVQTLHVAYEQARYGQESH